VGPAGPGGLDRPDRHRTVEVAANPALAVVALAVCSEADAFVAASLSQFSLTARLVFMVVGPVPSTGPSRQGMP
jgi:hypothetical protein